MSVPSISALTDGISLRPCTQARTKKLMKPSFTPYFFSIISLYWLRVWITVLMSTSLKVVSMAAVFGASLRRRAIVCRKRVMRTRSSRAASSAGAGARACTAAATGIGAAAARSIAAIMSPLVTRPSLPDPGTVETSSPLSVASLRTEGGTGVPEGNALAEDGGGAGAGSAAAAVATTGLDFSGLGAGLAGDAAPAPSRIWPSNAPTATVSPSLAAISASTPAAGDGTSIVTLSVSSSTSGSSTATASPGCLNHFPMVASVTDSPSVGTRISVIASFSYRRTEDGGRTTEDDWMPVS